MRGRRTGATAAVAAVAASLCLSSPIPAPARVAEEAGADVAADAVGAAGAGDPYYPGYGNGGYDVGHYDITIDYDVASGLLVGDTTVTATARQRLIRFNLDLELRPSAVWVDGEPARFRTHGRELVVTPATELAQGATFATRVTYAGRPARLREHLGGWWRTRDGAFAAGAPEVATYWFPSNDHPVDKATYDVAVTTAADRVVVSNGETLGTEPAGPGLATTHWRMDRPMATYLAMVAIGDFETRSGTSRAGTPYLLAVDRELPGPVRRRAWASLRRTAAVTDFYERAFGRYPFGSTGGVVVNKDIPFALENQGRPIYSRVFFERRRNDLVVAHELAHMWFGDSVSIRRWRDTWLSEGFASWATWRWEARRGGPSLTRQFRDMVATYDEYGGWGTRVQPSPRDDVYAGVVYGRGAMTLQALRHRIGARDHDRLLRRWARTRRDGHGTTRQFVRLAERISGEDLTGLFRAWLHRPGRPAETRANGWR